MVRPTTTAIVAVRRKDAERFGTTLAKYALQDELNQGDFRHYPEQNLYANSLGLDYWNSQHEDTYTELMELRAENERNRRELELLRLMANTTVAIRKRFISYYLKNLKRTSLRWFWVPDYTEGNRAAHWGNIALDRLLFANDAFVDIAHDSFVGLYGVTLEQADLILENDNMTKLCNSRARLLHNKPKALQDSDRLWASVLHGYLSLEVGERRGFIPDKTLENVIANRLSLFRWFK